MKKATSEQLVEQLENAYALWASHSRGEHCNYGCGDGAMMNMERNEILRLKKELTERNLDQYPSVFYQEVPDEVDRDLWVSMQSWEERGKKLFHEYKSDPHYLFLVSVYQQLTTKQKKESCIDAVLGYVSQFEDALNHWREETGSCTDYRWYLRRHVSCPFFDSFEQCAKRIQGMGITTGNSFITEESGQMSFVLV